MENYISKTMPAVPVKEGYTTEWNTKEFVLENKTVRAVYTKQDHGSSSNNTILYAATAAAAIAVVATAGVLPYRNRHKA